MQSIKKRSLVVLSFMFLAIIIDQVIKIAVKTNMSLGENFSVFGDWFKIYFIENIPVFPVENDSAGCMEKIILVVG